MDSSGFVVCHCDCACGLNPECKLVVYNKEDIQLLNIPLPWFADMLRVELFCIWNRFWLIFSTLLRQLKYLAKALDP